MSKFNYLKKMSIKGKTARFPLTGISLEKVIINADKEEEIEFKTPVLIVSPATDVNKPFFNASLVKMSKDLKRAVNTGNLEKEHHTQIRDLNKSLYPAHVIKGWEDVPNSDGKDEPFTEESCRDFLECLPNEEFDRLRLFCLDNKNFSDIIDIKRAEDIAKN